MHNMSALRLGMHTNNTYELITELHSFIQSTVALQPEVVKWFKWVKSQHTSPWKLKWNPTLFLPVRCTHWHNLFYDLRLWLCDKQNEPRPMQPVWHQRHGNCKWHRSYLIKSHLHRECGNLHITSTYFYSYLGTTITNQNLIQKENGRRLNSGNACYHSVQKLLYSRLLYKNIKIRIYKTIILPVVLYGCGT
jgi:hypothetical protein